MKRFAWAFAACFLATDCRALEKAPVLDVEDCFPADPAQGRVKNPVIFIGSSSIARWGKLAEDVGAPGAIRCGYSGAQTADAIPRIKAIVKHYRSSKVFYYFGDNDSAKEQPAGQIPKTPEQVLKNFDLFVDEIHGDPDPEIAAIPITFLSIKLSPSRWDVREKVMEANLKICRHARSNRKLDFIDVFDILLNDNGTPNADLFDKSDRLHLTEIGYKKWGELIRPWVASSERAVDRYGCVWTHAVVY